MSSNIDHVMTPVLEAYMEAKDIVELRARYKKDLPGSSFIEDHYKEAAKLLATRSKCDACAAENEPDAKFCKSCGAAITPVQQDMRIKLRNFWWLDTGSGHSFDILIKHIAPKVKGMAEVIFQWEEGDLEGLLIKDGRVAKCKVEPRLVKPEGW